jgi:ferric-dicitrate binding protein FerR (iron transport regulator)
MQPDHPVGDMNVERLLGASYKPEQPDAAFVQTVQARMRAAAQTLAARAPAPAVPDHVQRLRRRLGWAMAVAATVAAVALLWHAADRPERDAGKQIADEDESFKLPDAAKGPKWSGQQSEGLTAQPRAAVPEDVKVAIGSDLVTEPGQRRRVMLADGSVLYLNAGTRARYSAERTVELTQGEVYVEVSPRAAGSGATFVVKTADREVSALGTRFGVRAEAGQSAVVVTQGKVQVSGLDKLVYAGQQLAAGAKIPVPAERVTHLLDWTRELMIAAESPLVPRGEHCGGALVALDPNGQELRLSLRRYLVDVHIEDGFARTTIDQTYFNNETIRLEGTFYFPLPADAVLSRLAMYVKDGSECRLMEGGMAEREHARATYETILHTRRDPALLEWVDGSTFKMRVFPLEPREEKRIVLSYTQKLPALYGTARYRFPAGHSLPAAGQWSFRACVKDGAGLTCTSPSHPEMKFAAAGNDLVATAAATGATLKQDVTLELRDTSDAARAEDVARFSTSIHEGGKYLMLRYRPRLASQPKRERRDWVFVYEASANRDPLLARAQVDILRVLLENAEHNDTFTVVAAGTRVRLFDTQPRTAAPANVKDAVRFLEGVQLIGALDLGQALDAVQPTLASAENPYLVHVGSGVATLGERRADKLLAKLPARVKYVGIGVGKQWDRAFMKQAAERTGGAFTQINPDEPITWRAIDLLAALNTPRLLQVRVVDNDEKAAFLSDAALVAQGEEVCAVTRVDADQPLPKTVAVTGMLNGKPFVKELPVADVVGGAGYLPRQWAKLELDRLLAQDPEKNKARIIELSKASYVMTPYTSLLVLETDADYERFHVDRGRKDHWALYQLPQRVPVVAEWPQQQPVTDTKDGKRSPDKVLSSIVLRVPPQSMCYAGQAPPNLPPAATALQLYYGAYALPESIPAFYLYQDEMREFTYLWKLQGKDEAERSQWFENFNGRLPKLHLLRLQKELVLQQEFQERTKGKVGLESTALKYPPSDPRPRTYVFGPLKQSATEIASLIRQMYPESTLSLGVDDRTNSLVLGGAADALTYKVITKFVNELEKMPPSSRTLKVNQMKGVDPAIIEDVLVVIRGKKRATDTGGFGSGGGGFGGPGNKSPMFDSQIANNGGTGRVDGRKLKILAESWSKLPEAEQRVKFREMQQLIEGLPQLELYKPYWRQIAGEPLPEFFERFAKRPLEGGQIAPDLLLYQRPSFTGDPRFFSDLTLYAPGLQTSGADIDAVLETEATADPLAAPGDVELGAWVLVETARLRAGWHTYTVPTEGRRAAFAINFDGLGRFSWDRVLACGLREQVVCDGTTVWHLYPEIGLGSKRRYSRFHRAELEELVPWLLPPAEDLARGCDLKKIGKNSVALVPHGADKLRGDDGKLLPHLQIHLVFGEDHRLIERQLVLAPTGTVLFRQRYGADGTVTFHAGDDAKALSTTKLPIAAAQEPSLKPHLKELVVVPMPLRSLDYLAVCVPNQHDFETYDADTAIERLATLCANGNQAEAVELFGRRFHARGDHRIGFYVLLAGSGAGIDPTTVQPWGRGRGPVRLDVAAEHPTSPLAFYLSYQFETRVKGQESRLGKLGGPEDGFVQRLARARELFYSWQVGGKDDKAALDGIPANRDDTLQFVGKSPLPVMDWALLDAAIGARGIPAERDDHVPLIKVYQVTGERLGLEYEARYEAALAFRNAGRHTKARELWRKLYLDTVEAGELPRIEGHFREALKEPGDGGPSYTDLVRRAARTLAKRGQRLEGIGLAWQTHQLGDAELANELLATCLNACEPGLERGLVRLAAVRYYTATAQFTRGEGLMRLVLAEEPFKFSPSLWRQAAQLATDSRQPARAIACLEQALDLEYQHLPTVVDLASVRAEYANLLGHYQQMADALALLEKGPPPEFLARVVKAADRWRALDPDPTRVCQLTAKILQTVGAAELAWDYLTTPIGMKPNEAAPWLDLASALQTDGHLDLADKAYALAYDAEPTNAQILWDRARNLLQAGRTQDARQVYQAIADGTWQPRFEGLQNSAKEWLKNR